MTLNLGTYLRGKSFLDVGIAHYTGVPEPERMQGFAVDPVYAKGEVFAYAGLPQNLKDLKAN